VAFCVLPAKKIDKNKKRKMFRKTTEFLILTFFFEKFSVAQKKTKESFFAVFLVDSSARKHLAFLALTPPRVFHFPWGGF
jgi:hypothetical protein